MDSFVHLHLHTEYSLLDGAIRIKQLFPKLKELGMSSCAITDHGVMYGMVEFYEEALKNDIKPIIGCEIYTTLDDMSNKSGKGENNGHLVLLAKNNIGLRNLMKIVSKGFIDGFYYKPRVDYKVLKEYSEGIIALSGCMSGHIPKFILENNYDKAIKLAAKLNKIFGENNFFLEIQMHDIKGQSIINSNLVKISRELNIPLVATNDAHYLTKDNAKAHEVLLCIQTGTKITDESRMRFSSEEFYVKSYEEMKKKFPELDEALKNTVKIADRCNVKIDFESRHLPEFDIKTDKFEYLKELSYRGATEKYPKAKLKEVKERIDYELNTIKDMGFIDYFLIVWDFIKYAKENNIIVGPGRGSAAGSVVAYCLGITNIDSLKYQLIFERFLNPQRVSMPDIDIDFCYKRRQEVIDYVVEKYGKDKVCQIITFGTMAARAAIRDVARALDIPYGKADKIAKLIPSQIGITINRALELNPELKDLYNNEEETKDLIDMAILFEGMPRHASTHAAGVVIAKEPITNYVPLQKNDEVITTQLDMVTLERMGLLKMDFLGLRTLTVIQETCDMINDEIDIEKINTEDKNVYKMISNGDTKGVFQLESSGMTQFMKELKPTSLEDIIAGISLYRPGPMESIPTYIKNKDNPNNIEYITDELEDILDVTYGCIIYQEQVMQIFRKLANYSMGRADIVRRAMSKKKHDVMEKEEKFFIEGALKNGINEKKSKKIYDEIRSFASYAFNKSHAAAYALIGYQTAYLKRYYPVEFMTAILNSYTSNTDKIVMYIEETKNMGIDVQNPNINKSEFYFTCDNKAIRFGLCAIKNVGEKAINQVVLERESNGEFKDFEDFLERVSNLDINKRCIECLIKAGSLDCFNYNRKTMLMNFEKILTSIQNQNKQKLKGQISLFDINDQMDTSYNIITTEEFERKEILNLEKEVLGMYISGHPLNQFKDIIVDIKHEDIADLKDETAILNNQLKDRDKKTVVGVLQNITLKTTKNNNMMAFVTISDLTGYMEVIIFPNMLNEYRNLIYEDNIIVIDGSISIREDEDTKLIANKIYPIASRKKKRIILELDNLNDTETKKSLYSFLEVFCGNIKTELMYNNKKINKEFNCEYSEFFVEELRSRLGEEHVRIE